MALSKIDVANMVTGAVPVANGGTALTSGFVNGFTDFGIISIGTEQHTGFNLYTQGSFNSGGTITVYGITDGS